MIYECIPFKHITCHICYLDDFKKVSKAVAGVELNDHLVDLVFVIFDENGMSCSYY